MAKSESVRASCSVRWWERRVSLVAVVVDEGAGCEVEVDVV